MPPSDTLSDSSLLEILGLDLESALADEPRFLTDMRLLGALHGELRDQLGAAGAEAALFQMGFVHGLRDGAVLVQDGLRGTPWNRPPTAPRLAMRIAPRPSPDARCKGAGDPGSLEVEGSWPEGQEAEAVLAGIGTREAPACAASAGYTSGWLSGMFSADILVVEHACAAAGASSCRFLAREVADWSAREDERALARIASLPFAALREIVGQHLGDRPDATPAEGIQAGTPVVHIWGPVMILPFAGVDESLRALDLIGNDPSARSVRVVILDMSDAIVDEGFGAVALEQILASIGSWGAEVILTGLSPLSAHVVEDLEHAPLLCHKDLAEAVAAAFRIADVQRQAL